MTAVIIFSFCLGLIFGGIAVSAASTSELKRLRKELKGLR